MRKIEDSTTKKDAEVKSVSQLRIRHQIRYSDTEDQRPDEFMKYWIFLTNFNTITRKRTLLYQGIKCTFYSGSGKDMDVNLVGG